MVNGVDLFRMQDGKQAEHWGGPDMLSFLMQLGVMPDQARPPNGRKWGRPPVRGNEFGRLLWPLQRDGVTTRQPCHLDLRDGAADGGWRRCPPRPASLAMGTGSALRLISHSAVIDMVAWRTLSLGRVVTSAARAQPKGR
jgi:hypothetical protein